MTKRSSIDAGIAAAVIALCVTVPTAVVAGASEGFRLSTFEADITIPVGHACMGGGVADAREIVDPLYGREPNQRMPVQRGSHVAVERGQFQLGPAA